MEKIKNVLVTGNLGYIGNVLVPFLAERGYSVTGYDIGYYEDCLLVPLAQPLTRQIKKDIRDIDKDDLLGIDAVIHLAALSNDPLGEFSPSITEDINYGGTLRTAMLAREMGVKRFIYASSQSMYGVSSIDQELDEDDSEKHPLTAYAKTKWMAEEALRELDDENFTCVYFRPSTVFGVSSNLRCDIVFNSFVGSGYTSGKIEVKSDGTPWRPVVHIKDVCKAFTSGLEAPEELVKNRAFNVGIPDGNFSVRDLAEAAHSSIEGSELIFTGEHTDSRTYKVCFERILSELKDYYEPTWTLKSGAKELLAFFNEVDFDEKIYKGKMCNRLLKLRELSESGILDKDLRKV